MLTALGCRQLWDADSSGDTDIWKSACFRWVTLGHTSALDALSVHAFHAIRLFHAFMRYVLYHASCDMPCIMLHAICLVSYFMRKVCSMRGLGSRTYIEGSVQEELIKSNIYWADQSTDIVYPTTCFALTDRS